MIRYIYIIYILIYTVKKLGNTGTSSILSWTNVWGTSTIFSFTSASSVSNRFHHYCKATHKPFLKANSNFKHWSWKLLQFLKEFFAPNDEDHVFLMPTYLLIDAKNPKPPNVPHRWVSRPLWWLLAPVFAFRKVWGFTWVLIGWAQTPNTGVKTSGFTWRFIKVPEHKFTHCEAGFWQPPTSRYSQHCASDFFPTWSFWAQSMKRQYLRGEHRKKICVHKDTKEMHMYSQMFIYSILQQGMLSLFQCFI